MKQTKIYIAGPMTGLPDFNRGAFFNAAQVLLDVGHVAINPAVLPDGLEHGHYIKICLPMIEAAEAMILLPGWEKSKGANVELNYAKIMRIPVFEAEEGFWNEEQGRYIFPEPGIMASVDIMPLETKRWSVALRLTVLSTTNDPDSPSLSDLRP